MSTDLPEVISRYFERDADRDIDSIVSLFAEDATVIDEGEERHGTIEIRARQTGAAFASCRGSRPNSDVEKATGTAPTSFADFARRTAAAWAVDEAR